MSIKACVGFTALGVVVGSGYTAVYIFDKIVSNKAMKAALTEVTATKLTKLIYGEELSRPFPSRQSHHYSPTRS